MTRTLSSAVRELRSLTRLGAWTGTAAACALDAAPAGLRSAVIVQTRNAVPVLAAARL